MSQVFKRIALHDWCTIYEKDVTAVLCLRCWTKNYKKLKKQWKNRDICKKENRRLRKAI